MSKFRADYLRLSQDDDNDGESNSITSQRRIIAAYVSTVGGLSAMPSVEFVDDGYSGTNFNRPGVKRLLEAVRKGEISCIVVKDFSRFGRQYLEVSKFIEQVFPYLGVRFIAVNDHYDSNNHKGTTAGLDVPVRNMINAMYSKDISQKVKSAKQTQMKQGVFANAFAPFGYKKDETDRRRLLIDDPAATIVRRIFGLAGEGHTAFQIATKLNDDNILTPAAYKIRNGSKLAVNNTIRAVWTNEMISRILHDERYTGAFVGGKRENGKLGTGKRNRKPQDTWIKIPNAHPAIVSPELFNSLASARTTVCNKRGKPDANRILYKKVRCGYCGHILLYIGDASKPYYTCDTARYTDKYGCGREIIREKEIIDAVKLAVRSQIASILDIEKLCRAGKGKYKQSAPSAGAAMKPNGEVTQLLVFKRRLYERYKGGDIGKEAYFNEREAVESAITKKIAERDTLLIENQEHAGALNSAHQFFSSFLKYRSISEIPEGMIDGLVEAVYTYGTDKIEVRFSFRDELERAVEALEEQK